VAVTVAVEDHGKTAEDFKVEYHQRGKTTRKEALAVKSTTTKERKSEVQVDYRRYSIYELLMHLYRNTGEWSALRGELASKAEFIGSRLSFPPRVAVVVDNSGSHLGSGERLHQPRASMEATLRVLMACEGSEVRPFHVGPPLEEDSWLKVEGHTELRLPLARALAWKPDLVIVLSDGYENVRAGSVSQILSTKAFRNSGISVIHLNPVAAAETSSLRRISESVVPYGLVDVAQLPMVILLGQAEADPALLESFFDRVARLLKSPVFKNPPLLEKRVKALCTVSGQAPTNESDEEPLVLRREASQC